MTAAVALQLLGIFTVVAIGYAAARAGWLGGEEAAPVLSGVAFTVLVPALLFRITSQMSFASLPWTLLLAFFVPTVGWMAGYYVVARTRRVQPREGRAVGSAVGAITVSFGNTVQVGIPVATALFGAAGLRLHVAIVSLHALVLLTLATALAEIDLARARAGITGGRTSAMLTALATARRTVVHPVVMPVLAGLSWNLAAGHVFGAQLPGAVEEVLRLLSQGVVPVSLILIGVSLAHYGVRGRLRSAAVLAALKLLALPGLVLLGGHWVLGLTGLPLHVAVMCAGLPVGSNALLFAQRYRTLEGETTTAIVFSTVAFVLTSSCWLVAMSTLGV